MANSYRNEGLTKGYDAEAAITKYRAVKAGATAEGVTPVAASTDIIRGIALFGVTTAEIARGKGATVQLDGIAEWEAGAAIAEGVDVFCGADGRCVPVATAASGDRRHGVTLQAAAGAGSIVPVVLDLNDYPKP